LTSLLPNEIFDAVTDLETYAASESFGIVTLVVLVLLLVEREALSVAGVRGLTPLSALAFPLLLVVAVTIVMRLVILSR
jgi:hypothetical protein